MIIGFGHKKQTGKDTCGRVVRYLTYSRICSGMDIEPLDFYDKWEKENMVDWQVRRFADKLKQVAAILLGVDVEEFEDPTFKDEDIFGWPVETVREFLQWLGTDVMRKAMPDIWVHALMTEYAVADENWIITDVRFPNECDAIHDAGGLVIRVDNKHAPKDYHESETALDNWDGWDAVIKNDGSIDELIVRVNSTFRKLDLW